MTRNATNKLLQKAKKSKSDEFYTQLCDIEKELQHYCGHFNNKTVYCNCDDPRVSNFFTYFVSKFKQLGLKKVIAACYKENGQGFYYEYSGLENQSKKPTLNDVVFFNGDGDFRSNESIDLLEQSDIVVTNPPFSLFRDFVSLIVSHNKQFLIIGNVNAITYKEVFPLIKKNKVWLGVTNFNVGMYFLVPNGFVYKDTYKFQREINGKAVNRVPGVCWYSNIEHERRHEPLSLMTMEDNLRFSKHKDLKGKTTYDHYDNYDAIEVPFTDSIPSDYDGVMGVPITFLHKFNPEQFKIIQFRKGDDGKDLSINGKSTYFRILIKNRHL